jgi:hypothetical protein
MRGRLVLIACLALLLGGLLAPSALARISFTRTDTDVSFAPEDIAIADFDGKRGPDLALAEAGGASVRILLNRGNGKFRAPVKESACDGARELVVGQLNPGKALDLMVDCGFRNFGAVTLLGDGRGGFAPAKSAGAGLYVQAGLALGHMNGPGGAVDVAFQGFTPGIGGILCHAIGKGNGTFRDQTCAQDPVGGAYTVTSSPPIALADLSGDRGLEAATFAFDDGKENVAFFGWRFREFPKTGFNPYPSLHQTRSSYGTAIRLVDLDSDGIRDVVTGETIGKLSVQKIRARSVDRARLFEVGGRLDDMSLGDFNDDGRLDAASASPVPVRSPTSPLGSVRINTGNGNATFRTPARAFPAGVNGGTHHLAVGDLNRDGRPDVAVAELATGKLSILLSN